MTRALRAGCGDLSTAPTRRRVLVAFASLGIWWGAWGALVPDVQRHARVDDGQLGVALLCVGVGALACMRATGGLMDRRGDLVLPLAVVGLAATGILPAFARGTLALSMSLAVVGALSGALDVAINTAAVHAEATTGTPIMSLAHGMFSVGVIAASAGTGILRALDLSPAAVLGLVALLLVACSAAIVVDGRDVAARAPASSEHRVGPPWWRPPPRLLVIGALTALAFLTESVWQTWAAVHLERDLHTSALIGSLGPALFGVAAAAGRLGGHRLEAGHDRRALVARGALVAAGGTVLAALAPVTALVFAGIAAAGLGTAIAAPSLFGVAGDGVAPQWRGAAIGTVTTLGYLGFVLAPAIVGGLARASTLPIALASTAIATAALAAGAPFARPARADENM